MKDRYQKRNDRIAEMSREGMSIDDIADHFCLAPNTVREILIELNVLTRAPERMADWAYANWDKARRAARKQLEEMRA